MAPIGFTDKEACGYITANKKHKECDHTSMLMIVIVMVAMTLVNLAAFDPNPVRWTFSLSSGENMLLGYSPGWSGVRWCCCSTRSCVTALLRLLIPTMSISNLQSS